MPLQILEKSHKQTGGIFKADSAFCNYEYMIILEWQMKVPKWPLDGQGYIKIKQAATSMRSSSEWAYIYCNNSFPWKVTGAFLWKVGKREKRTLYEVGYFSVQFTRKSCPHQSNQKYIHAWAKQGNIFGTRNCVSPLYTKNILEIFVRRKNPRIINIDFNILFSVDNPHKFQVLYKGPKAIAPPWLSTKSSS